MTVAEFEHFLEAYERDVFTFCRYLANNTDTAGDLYQETALAAFQMIDRIDKNSNPKSLLFAIAAGKWKNMRRKSFRRQSIAPELPLEDWANTATAQSPTEDAAQSPTEDAAQNSLQQQAIHNAVAEMKDKFRVPLILHYFDNCPTEEIAQVCNIPVGTVKSRLHKARALLKKTLEKEGYNYG